MVLTGCKIESYFIFKSFFMDLFYLLKLGFMGIQGVKKGIIFFSPVFPQRAVYKFGTVLVCGRCLQFFLIIRKECFTFAVL